jgi:cobalt-zinc-cadmium efflux system membrane fusion protein
MFVDRRKVARFTAAELLVASALLSLLLTGCQGATPAPSHEEHAHEELAAGVVHLPPAKLSEVDLVTAPVELKPLMPELETTGEVDYEQDRMAHVSPRIPGRLHRVPAKLGDRVAAGQTLAVIDSVELGEAKAHYLAARASEEVARENYEREQRLQADHISSEKDMLEARGALKETTALRQSAEETLRLYGLGQEEIDGLEAGTPGSSLLTVRAPFAGRVVDKHATLGELVTPENNLFTLADLSRVWIWIDVYEQDLAAVHLGDGVEVRVAAHPGVVFRGEVSYVGPEVAADTRTVHARIDVANPAMELRPGMFARVRLTDPHAETAHSALTVPESALQRDIEDGGEESIVFVPLGEGRFERRTVEIGRRQGAVAEILNGLREGERVVTEGTFVLKSELSREELGGGHHH